jgi:hypothetical protein
VTKRLGLVPRSILVIFCVLSFAVSARQAIFYLSRGPQASDLRIFMTGIEILKSGHGQQLYQYPLQTTVQANLYPDTRQKMLPFNHLAFELLFYWPVSHLPYVPAMSLWAALNLALIFVIAVLLRPYTSCLAGVTGIPVALFILAFYPSVFTLAEAQDSIIFLLMIVLSLRCMDANRTFLAGMLLALGCFKPHLALLMGFFVFLLGRKWRAVAGFAAGVALAVAVSLAMAGPSMLHDYVSMLRGQETMAPWGFLSFYMPNIRGLLHWALFRYLEPGQILPIVFMTSVIVCVISGWLVVRRRVPQGSALLYSVAVLTTVLVSYHLHMQDLTMAVVPMLVMADLALRNQFASGRFLRAWVVALTLSISVLFAWRPVAEVFQSWFGPSCYLAVPVFLLWIVALRSFTESRSTLALDDSQAAGSRSVLAAVSGA